jgi:hypothetical protein
MFQEGGGGDPMMLIKQMSEGMAMQSEYNHLMSGTESNAIDFSKKMIDIHEMDKAKEGLFK